LEPVPQHRVSLRVTLASRHDLVAQIELLRQWHPATLELLDSSFLAVVLPRATAADADLWRKAGAVLLLDFEGEDLDDVTLRAAAAAAAVRATAIDVTVATEPGAIAALWQVRHGASPALAALSDGRRSLQVIEDACVPTTALAEYLDTVDRISRDQSIEAVMFGHAGDGHVHVNLLPNLGDPRWKDRVRAIYLAVSEAVIGLGGTVTGEHGAGRVRAGLLPAMYGDSVMECFRAVKDAFDPQQRFNSGVIIDDGSDPLARLKLGDDAASLPPGVAESLHAIEAGARWGDRRWPGVE
jgi:FAD/FMN-containing dehydrogenase